MRVHEQVMARIEEDLAAGRLTLGDRLPAERALAEQLGVSRPGVRESIRVLEALGVIRTATGSGPDAGAVLIAEPATGLATAMRLHVATSGVPVEDVVALRLLVEGWAAREAALRVATSADELARAEALLDAMDEPGLDPDRFLDLDGAFHAAIVRCSGNVLVEAVMAGVRGAVRAYVGMGARRVPDWARTVERLRAEHRRIFEAISAGRVDDAEREIQAHVEGYYRDAGIGTTGDPSGRARS